MIRFRWVFKYKDISHILPHVKQLSLFVMEDNKKLGAMRKLRSQTQLKQEIISKSSNDSPVKAKRSKVTVTKKSSTVLIKKEILLSKSEEESSLKEGKKPAQNLVSPKIEDKKLLPKNKAKSEIQDIENVGWQPENWKEVFDNILKMRKQFWAPVDSLGAECCADVKATSKLFRYQTLVALMLSSQTKDQVTHAAMQRLIAHGLTVDNVLKTSDEKFGELIYPVGFWKSKVNYIKKTTQILRDQYDQDIPKTLKELCKLPGVGPKMGNLAMSIGWNETVGIAVDTHVHRISNRLGWVQKPTKQPEQTRVALEGWLPKHLWKDINLELVGFGQTVCKPINPSCKDCLNNKLCPLGKKNVS